MTTTVLAPQETTPPWSATTDDPGVNRSPLWSSSLNVAGTCPLLRYAYRAANGNPPSKIVTLAPWPQMPVRMMW